MFTTTWSCTSNHFVITKPPGAGGLPRYLLSKLLYSSPAPWSGGWEAPSGDWEATSGDTDYSAHKLPGKTDPTYAAVYAAVNDGSGFWYDVNGDPVARLVSEILADGKTNKWNIWCNSRGRLMVFAKTLLYSEVISVERYMIKTVFPSKAPPTQSDIVLHYDADKEELLELTRGVSTFNYNVLSPQYERQVDGSHVDVGARPAVDTFDDGFVGLRSCGAVTNLLPSGSDVFETWGKTGVVADGPVWRGTLSYNSMYKSYSSAPVGTYTFSVEKLSSTRGDGTIALTVTHSGGTTIFTESNKFITFTTTSIASIVVYIGSSSSWTFNEIVDVAKPMLTATAYPVPYVPPGVTQPASNATSTGGNWFTNPDGSPLWQSLTGAPLTLATRVKMGVGSGDIGNSVYLRFFDCDVTLSRLVYVGRSSGGVLYQSRSYDGVNFAELTGGSWSRNSVIRQFVQVNTAGTRFRAGYMIEGTHTTIQWSHPSEDSSTWAAYDGSFNPSTLYRLMLGYITPQPMWFNKITVWKRQVPDDELAVAWL